MESIEISGRDFRVERVNEVSLHFDRADIEVTDKDLLIVKDAADGSVLAVYNPFSWEAVIFRDKGSDDA